MAHWIIEDYGFGGSYYKCSKCGEGWNDIYRSVSMEDNCPACGAPMNEENEYIEDKKTTLKGENHTSKHNAVTIELKDGQTGYDVVGEYILRYWKHNVYESVVVSMAVSYNGRAYDLYNAIAIPSDGCDDVEFIYDWWEGEKFIKVLGIEPVSDLRIHGGIYEE